MATWKQASPGALIPTPLTSVIGVAQTVAGTVSTILNAIKTAVNIAKTFVISVPAFDFAAALQLALTAFKNDFLASGFYMLEMWNYPLYQIKRAGGAVIGETFASSFQTDVIDAFVDPYDSNKPPFMGDCAALILVVAAPGIDAVTNIMMTLKDALSWWGGVKSVYESLMKIELQTKVDEVRAQLKRGDLKLNNKEKQSQATLSLLALNLALQQAKSVVRTDAYETNIRPYVPTISSTPAQVLQFIDIVKREVTDPPYPNFQQASLKTVFPALPNIIDTALDPLLKGLSTGRSIADTIDALADALDAKVDSLNQVVESIDLIISQVEGLLTNNDLSALWVTSSTGMTGLANAIEQAENKPLGDGTPGYFSGIVLIGGGPSLSVFKNLFAPVAGEAP